MNVKPPTGKITFICQTIIVSISQHDEPPTTANFLDRYNSVKLPNLLKNAEMASNSKIGRKFPPYLGVNQRYPNTSSKHCTLTCVTTGPRTMDD